MKQQGIALIQILLLTAILSILALYLTKTAQEQVTMAQWSNDKAQALVELHSVESQLMFVAPVLAAILDISIGHPVV